MHKLFRAIPMTPLLIALLAFAAAACGGDGEPTAVPIDAVAAAEAASVEATAVAATTAVDAPALAEVATPVGDLGETPKELPEDLKAIWEAWVLLNREYVDKDKLANPDEFTEGAIRGMTRVLEDSGTYYLPPRVASTMRQDIQGKFEGIGAHVNMNAAGKLLIVAPIEGSPAEEAGILAGDTVLEVDGESIEGLSLMEAVSKIRGPRGTIVRLLVMHLGAIDPIEISVRRGVIPLISVRLRSEEGDRFAHIRIYDFYANTPEQLKLEAPRGHRRRGRGADPRHSHESGRDPQRDHRSREPVPGRRPRDVQPRRRRQPDRLRGAPRRDRQGYPHGSAHKRVHGERPRDHRGRAAGPQEGHDHRGPRRSARGA